MIFFIFHKKYKMIKTIYDFVPFMESVPETVKILVRYENARFNESGTDFKKENMKSGFISRSTYNEDGSLKVLDGELFANMKIVFQGMKELTFKTSIPPEVFRKNFQELFPHYIVFSYGTITPNGIVGAKYDRGALC